MKLLFLLLIPTLSFSQISKPFKSGPLTTVGKVSQVGAFIAELRYSINPDNNADTVYELEFNNYKYRTIREREVVVFSGVDNTIGKLYELFKSVFADENKDNKDYAVSFKLGAYDAVISHYKTMGVTMAAFLVKDGILYLTNKQVDKLFGVN